MLHRAALLAWLVGLLSLGALADPHERVYLRADKVDSSRPVVVASGRVRIEIAGIRLHCDRLEYEPDTGRVSASGDCVFYWEDSFLTAGRIEFNSKTHKAHMEKVAGQGRDFLVDNRNLEADVFFWAEKVEWSPQFVELEKAVLTTCNLPPGRTDYTLESARIEVYPRSRLVASDVELSLGDTTIYAVPTIDLSLSSEAPQRIQPFLPRVGNNGVDGFFIRNSFDYSLGDRDYGQVLVDLYQLSGLGAGLKHHYSLGNVGWGELYLYEVRGRQSNRQRFQIRSLTELQPDPFSNLKVFYQVNRFELPDFVSPVNENGQVDFTRRTDRQDLQVLGNFSRLGGNDNTFYRLYYKLKLSPELSSRVQAEYYNTVTAVRRTDRWHYLGSLNHVGELFDSELAVENGGGQATYFLNRNPELSLQSKPIFLGPVPLRVGTSVGNLTESPSMFNTSRADMRLTIPDQTVEFGSGRLVAGAGVRQLVYGSGDAQYVLATRASYLQNLGSYFTSRIDYNWQDPRGFTPFQHDLQFPYHTVTGGIEFHDSGTWSLGALAGYDVRNDRLHDLMPRLDIRPTDGLQLTAASDFDPNFRQWRSFDSQIRFQLTDNLSVAHWSLYDLVNERLTYQDFQVNLESHDWLASVVYRGVQNEVYLQFSLKAFPLQTPSIGPALDRPVLPSQREPYLR